MGTALAATAERESRLSPEASFWGDLDQRKYRYDEERNSQVIGRSLQ